MGPRRPVWKLPGCLGPGRLPRPAGQRTPQQPVPAGREQHREEHILQDGKHHHGPHDLDQPRPRHQVTPGALAGRYPWAARRSGLLGPPCSPAANATAASAPTPGPTR